MTRKKTHNEFIQEIFNLVGDEYEVLEEYISAKTKINIKHNICGYIWHCLPNSFLTGIRCPNCKGGVKRTHEEFVNLVHNLSKGEYKVLTQYVNSHSVVKFQHICEKCNNHIWQERPYVFLNYFKTGGIPCKKCSLDKFRISITKSNDTFKEELLEKVGNEYIALEEYKGVQIKIKFRHNVPDCMHEFLMTPNSFLSIYNERCPKCYGTPKKTQEEFEQEVFDLYGDEYSVYSAYEAAPSQILHYGIKCPYCFDDIRSKGELKIKEYLENNNINFIPQYIVDDCKSINKISLRFDFAILNSSNTLLFLIEYDGQQHYYPIDWFGGEESYRRCVENDEIKNNYCEENKIKLIRIPYWEYENIENLLCIYLNKEVAK